LKEERVGLKVFIVALYLGDNFLEEIPYRFLNKSDV